MLHCGLTDAPSGSRGSPPLPGGIGPLSLAFETGRAAVTRSILLAVVACVVFAPTAMARTTQTLVSCNPVELVVAQDTVCRAVTWDTDAGPASTPTGTATFTTGGSGALSDPAS